MKDHLRETGNSLNINIIYTDNKVTILSCSASNNTPVIRAHKMFEGCQRQVAEAIIHYYTEMQNREDFLSTIQAYVNENFDSSKYRIMPPDKAFENYFAKSSIPKAKEEGNISKIQEDPSLVEFEIAQITVKDFWGDDMELQTDKTINVSSSNMIELDIEVNNP